MWIKLFILYRKSRITHKIKTKSRKILFIACKMTSFSYIEISPESSRFERSTIVVMSTTIAERKQLLGYPGIGGKYDIPQHIQSWMLVGKPKLLHPLSKWYTTDYEINTFSFQRLRPWTVPPRSKFLATSLRQGRPLFNSDNVSSIERGVIPCQTIQWKKNPSQICLKLCT